jgi:hypothetical protein
MNDYTLQRYRLYAATVPLYNDTCSYMYKKTCSYQPQVVNNTLNAKWIVLLICVLSLSISGCYKQTPSEKIQNAAFNLSSSPHRTFRQVPGNTYKPSAYFTCGEMIDPCPYISNIGKQINFSKVNKSKKSNHFNFKGE